MRWLCRHGRVGVDTLRARRKFAILMYDMFPSKTNNVHYQGLKAKNGWRLLLLLWLLLLLLLLVAATGERQLSILASG